MYGNRIVFMCQAFALLLLAPFTICIYPGLEGVGFWLSVSCLGFLVYVSGNRADGFWSSAEGP